MQNAAPERDILDARVHVPSHVVYRSFPAETVVLNLETGVYHGLNATGGRMLAELEKAPSVRDAARVLALAYEVPRERIEADLTVICAELTARGLIVLEDAGRA